MRELVRFKGNREGLIIVLEPEGDFQEVLEKLAEKLAAANGFLTCSGVSVDLGPRDLQPGQLRSLENIFVQNKLSLRRILAGSSCQEGFLPREEGVRAVSQEAVKVPASWRSRGKRRHKRSFSSDGSAFSGGCEQKLGGEDQGKTSEGEINRDVPVIHYSSPARVLRRDIVSEEETILVQRTIRSGQRVFYPGNIVVLGDVNPGGEVIAGGNIIVMGSFRGVAHAGALGNENAIVTAFRLEPSQLRIAGYITRAPEGDFLLPQQPEIARVQDGVVIIEKYQPGYDRHSRG